MKNLVTALAIASILAATIFAAITLAPDVGAQEVPQQASTITFQGGRLRLGSGARFTINGQNQTIVGYSEHPQNYDAAGRELMYDQMDQLGAQYIRFDLYVADIQATSSASYVWGTYDTYVTEAQAHGFDVLLIINGGWPSWGRYSGCVTNNCPPNTAAIMRTFATAAANHFNGTNGPLVTNWEIWNEPNLSSWANITGATTTSTDFYTLNANQAAIGIHSVRPTDNVFAGSLGGGGDEVDATSPLTWVTRMYSATTTYEWDGISDHPYTYQASPDYVASWNQWQRMEDIRDIMVAHGDGAKPIWITEYGAPTCGTGDAFEVDDFSTAFDYGIDYMTYGAQSDLYELAIANIKASPWIERTYAYEFKDQNTDDHSTPENCFGIIEDDGTWKPAASYISSH